MNNPAALYAPASLNVRFSVAEYVAVCEATDMRLELVDGELQRMSPARNAHATRQGDIYAMLRAIDRSRAKVEAGIQLDENTVLGCDVAWLHAAAQQADFLRPEQVALAIEVSDTTLGRDLGFKRQRYAAAGIAHYWVVDAGRSVVHVYSDLVDGDYAQISTVRFGEPLAVPGTDQTIVIE